jgi:hypothetical protein
MAEQVTAEISVDDAIVEGIKKTVQALQELCTQAADRDIVITIDQASMEVNGIPKPVFAFRGAFKRLLKPTILRV